MSTTLPYRELTWERSRCLICNEHFGYREHAEDHMGHVGHGHLEILDIPEPKESEARD